VKQLNQRENQMIQTINSSQFHDAFNRMDRGTQFSYEALNLIYEYFEDVEQDTGEKIELDVIAICCEYSEMTPEEVMQSYSLDENEDVLEFLAMNTTVVGECNGSIVFAQF